MKKVFIILLLLLLLAFISCSSFENSKNSLLILAIHGKIEPPTADMAKKIARDRYNLYIHMDDKHVTSSKFNRPDALELAYKSNICISLHGFKSDDELVCMGGLNLKAKNLITNKLRDNFSNIKFKGDCKKIMGISKENIVNKCKKYGVQIEISEKLRKDNLFIKEFTNSLIMILDANFDNF